MIEFISLFLGLVSGVQPVHLEVVAPVAVVELRLDGALVATLEGPPWSAQVDFGSAPLPHELRAVGRDGEGRAVAEAVQSLNVPRPAAEAGIVLLPAAEGQPAAARLSWQSVEHVRPEAITFSFDGEPVEVLDPQRIPLPPFDPAVFHVVHAELRFADGTVAQADVTIGGHYLDEVSTALTAVPLLLEPGRNLPAAAGLGMWIVKDGEPLTVVAVERGPADIMVVRDVGTKPHLDDMFRSTAVPRAFEQNPQSYLHGTQLLDPDDRIRFLWTAARATPRPGVEMTLFPSTPDRSSREGSLFWSAVRTRWPAVEPAAQQLADAVAVAGLQAAARNRRRAVVLVLTTGRRDASQLEVAAVRRYLAALRVPLVVWTVDAASRGEDPLWGPVEDVSSYLGWNRAVRDLKRLLARQRIVWVEGNHLPHTLALGPAAERVQLAAR